ncbi:hypothetical protein [Psychrobacter sp. PAMC 21119]|uniref:hypothetical protein n=1 Tax=Psychrobacter sp. PAMC 21119 TaxID=1112209 RepID=UPI000288C627|nr:hypothetical protein [Psychrobacter sp. PAMC 21119]
MSQSNDVLEPCLVAVDSHTLSVVDDYIQDYSNECESLAYALNMIEVNDPASKGVIVAIRSALFAISENASELSDGLMTQLILQPQVEVISHE